MINKPQCEERKESGREGLRGLDRRIQPVLSLEQMEPQPCVCFVINETACQQDNAGGMLI